MSEPREPAPRTVSPWWLLLLLPIPLFIGHVIGNVSMPTPKAGAAAHAAAPAAMGRVAVQPAPPAAAAAPEAAPPEPDQAPGARGVQWSDLTSALAESQRTGKPVMIDFNADWCGPCQRMKHMAFENPSIARAVEAAVIPVSIVDRAREEGANPPEIENLQQKFGINAFPTLVVILPSTGKTVKQEGFLGAEGTGAWIVQAAAFVKQ